VSQALNSEVSHCCFLKLSYFYVLKCYRSS